MIVLKALEVYDEGLGKLLDACAFKSSYRSTNLLAKVSVLSLHPLPLREVE